MSKKGLTIIVPAWNEQDNVRPLIQRIDETLKGINVPYEVIVIDDHSSDMTVQRARRLAKLYPVSVYLKKGKRGKAESLLQGFTYAKYSLISFIDADLQYPPEA